MSRTSTLLATAAVAALASLGGAASASAACTSSTPSSVTATDPADDGSAAPEITGVTAALDAACGVTVDVAIQRPFFYGGESLYVYVDADGVQATGNNGAERLVKLTYAVDGSGTGATIEQSTWDGSSFSSPTSAGLTARGLTGFSASLDTLGITAPATVKLHVVAYSGGFGRVFEDKVDPVSFPVAFAVPAPPLVVPPSMPVPPTVTTPAPRPAPTVTPTTRRSTTRSCLVPRLQGLTTAGAKRRLKARNCQLARTRKVRSRSVRSGRVISSSVRAGSRTTKSVSLTVSSGRGRR